MSDPLELQSLSDAAEQAGAQGNWDSAEVLLRRALKAQKKHFGGSHPDLANTLNNLGVVCEKTGKDDEAEQCYRRAYAIARDLLPADDPLVVTSGQNLREFCDLRGHPFEEVTAPIAATTRPTFTITTTPQTRKLEAPPGRSRVVASITVAAAIAIALFVAAGRWFGSEEELRESPNAAVPAEPASPAESEGNPTAVPPTTASGDPSPAAPPSAVETTVTERAAAVEAARPIRSPAGPSSVSVVAAQLCKPLSTDWRCTPAANPANPGLFSFYTRLRSPIDTNVQHRWYYEGRLLQAVTLRVTANQGAGYRTYSRTTITAERSGSWSVEVRSREGAVLHEERFQVLN